jgi:pyrroline-5-carboxylate reductase
MKLTIIGAGKMAEAIIGGALKDYEVELVARDPKKMATLIKKYPKLKNGGILDSPVDIENKNLVLCIKPNALESVGIYLDGEANSVISVLAGSGIETIQKSIKAKFYVRAMPNLAASNQKSMTTLCGDKNFKEQSLKICESFGKTLWLNSEKEIDIATAVAGSGPAYLALVAEALADGGVKEGLKRDDAKALVEGLFSGFSSILEGKHPAIIKDEVMSPGGTTAAGYSALEEGSVRDGFIKAVGKAYERARG